MTSSNYLELLKLKRAKSSKVLNLYESGASERSDFAKKHLCGSDNVSSNHSNDAVLILAFIRDVKLECHNKTLIKLRDSCCGKYLLCSVPDCGYKGRFPRDMALHELVHHSDEKAFKCRDCKYATNWKQSLKEHQVKMHSKNTECNKVFVCEFNGCNYRTSRNCRAIEHRRRHLINKPFKCHHPDCGFSFVTRGNLNRHKITHAVKKPFRCMRNNCKFATKHRFNLYLHQATHSSVRAFKCPNKNCNYAAKRRDNLRIHSLTHSEGKPCKCGFKHCNYASNNKQCLKRHRAVHSEVRPFKCDYKNCSYAGRQKGNLVRHKMGHERKRTGKGEK